MRERRLTGSLKVSDQAGRRNVGGLRYKRSQPEPDANAPPRGVRGRSHSPDWKQHMPSRTRTPGHPPTPSRVPLTAPPARDEPPGTPEPAAPAAAPAWSGLRLIAVPAGWPPYDCETHGAACPATAGNPEAGRQPPGSVPACVAPSAEAAATTTDAGDAAAASTTGAGGPAAPSLATAWPGQFARVLVEILAGFRPPKQLAPWTTERSRAQIDQLRC